MPDKPPLLVRRAFGALRPTNSVTESAILAYPEDAVLRVKITKASGNTKRNALYWVVLAVFCEHMAERLPGATPAAMHRKLKRDLGLAAPIVSAKTGEIIDYDYESISFNSMPEHERSEYVNAAFDKLASWLGCTVQELTQEGMAA
ncbi:MAG: hypothetical protein AAFW97_13100 [Pseudomonadota bacterium]